LNDELNAVTTYAGQIHPTATFHFPPAPLELPITFLMSFKDEGEFVVRVVIPARYPESPPRVYIEKPEKMTTGPRMGSKSVFEDAERLRIIGKSTEDKPEIAVKFDGITDSIYLVLQRSVRWCLTMKEEWKSG